MSQLLTSAEVKKHNTRKSLWIVIKNDVYDVTPYLNEHPGGEDPLLDAAGQDATRAFEDVGHSEDARSIMRKYKIGSLVKGESCGATRSHSKTALCPNISSSKVKLPIPRVPSIVVPRERRRRGYPCSEGRGAASKKSSPRPSGSKLKWALLALGAAIIIGIAYKKYVAS